MSRETIRTYGTTWQTALTPGTSLAGIAPGTPVTAATAFSPLAGRVLNTRSSGTNSLFGSFSAGGVDVNTVIDALDSEGLVTVLAEPNLTALSGETASFLAGGEFPIPVPQQNGIVTIDYKKFGVSL